MSNKTRVPLLSILLHSWPTKIILYSGVVLTIYVQFTTGSLFHAALVSFVFIALLAHRFVSGSLPEMEDDLLVIAFFVLSGVFLVVPHVYHSAEDENGVVTIIDGRTNFSKTLWAFPPYTLEPPVHKNYQYQIDPVVEANTSDGYRLQATIDLGPLVIDSEEDAIYVARFQPTPKEHIASEIENELARAFAEVVADKPFSAIANKVQLARDLSRAINTAVFSGKLRLRWNGNLSLRRDLTINFPESRHD